MQFHRLFSGLLYAGMIMPAVSSCIYEYDTCQPERGIIIVNDWELVAKASPKGMAFICFPEDGSVPGRFDFPGMEGWMVNMPQGRYSMLSFNDDTYNVRFIENEGYGGYTAYTEKADNVAFEGSEVAPPVRLPEKQTDVGENFVECPDMMWGCSYCAVTIGNTTLTYEESGGGGPYSVPVTSASFLLEAHQRQLTARYRFTIDDVENLDGVKAMSATFSGLAGAENLADGRKTAYPSTLPSKVDIYGDSTIGGDFVTFGIPCEPTAENTLSLMVLLHDGRKFNYRFDVTDQVRAAENPLDVHVRIAGLSLEPSTPGGDSGAFEVGVDGWISITINIDS